MQRFGNLIRLKPEYEERYIILHKYVFPGVLEQIKKSGIRNYSIYLRDGILFAYFEYTGSDFKADMDRMAQDPVTKEWWKLTDPMQEQLESGNGKDWWVTSEEVFHMDEITKPYQDAERFGSVIGLRPEFATEYKKLHSAVWPGVLEQIKKSNIQNYSIYLHNYILYSYFEYTGSDFRGDMEKMAQDAETQRWWAECMPMQKKIPDAPENDWWTDMKEVFHID